MKKSHYFITILLSAATIVAFSFFTLKGNEAKLKKAQATITATNSTETPVTGTLKFSEQRNGEVKMVLDITVPNKANQSVAVHIHEHGDCGEAGNLAHGHWNPTGKKHGMWGSGEFHSGDIGNVKLNAKGKGRMMISSNLWTIGGSETTNILNKGVIVHGGVDDYTSQPAGNAGPRIGCGVITAK